MPARCEVELDIFSGMPNPTWRLSVPEADTFARRLGSLPRGSWESGRPGELGYRGMIVRCDDGESQVVHLYRGRVEISSRSGRWVARDANGQMERWVADTGKPHLNKDVFDELRRVLG